MAEENHGDREAQRPAKHENSQIKTKVVAWLKRRTRMEIFAFGLMALSAVVFVIVGILYNSHKKSMIVLFGIGFLLVDAAVCAFWLNKVQSDDSKVGQTAQDQQPIKAANESKASEPLPKPSGETMPPRTPPVETAPAPPPQSHLKPEDKNDKTRERDMANKDKKQPPPSVSQTMTNSPGGIQAGRDVIITHGPQPRMLTAQQTNIIARELRKYAGARIEVFEIGDQEANDFARQFIAIIRSSGWQVSVSHAEQMVPIPYGLTLRTPRRESPEAIALQNALAIAGLPVTVRIQADLPQPSLLVGLRPSR